MTSMVNAIREIEQRVDMRMNHRGVPKLYPVEGMKNVRTDIVGYEAFKELEKIYHKPGMNLAERKLLRIEVTRLYDFLRKQGRLYRRDGSRI